MGNEYDYKGKNFETKAVSRSEFEALRRFGDYTELQDGTLMRVEDDKEFRIYREDSDWPSGIIVTEGALSMLSEFSTMFIQGKQMMQASKARHSDKCDFHAAVDLKP
jgi:hypothetical protein